MALWLPGWEVIEGNDAGAWSTGSRHPKLVLHTTEGTSIDGALAAYRAHNSWPHCTVDYRTKRRVQHVPLNRPARALRNRSGGVETGRAPIVIQVEIMGFASKSHLWSAAENDWLGASVVAPLCEAAGIPKRTSVDFHGEHAGWTLATESARQRLSGPAWLAYEGVLGHQHAPENGHWDPGALNIDRVLAAANHDTSEEDDMPLSDADLAKIDALILKRLQPLNDDVTRVLTDAKNQTGRLEGLKVRLDNLLARKG